MWSLRALLGGVTIFLLCLGPGANLPASANPHNYPQFAQQQVDPAIPITFVKVHQVKQRLDDGSPQMLVDVRTPEEYAQGHLPRAVSMPLGTLLGRMAEIPRSIPIVLY
ncbi:MAG: rhodanese-like domain-containing protein [Candidatus Tectimicrobiota bacterium]